MPSSTTTAPATAAEYAALAAKQVGKRYILGKPTPHKGGNPPAFDCSGLVIWLNNATRALLQGDTTAAGLYNASIPIAAGHEKVGDLVFLANNPARSNGIGHVAVLTQKLSNGDWRIIEARGKASGVVKTTLSYWKTRRHYAGVRRLKGFKLATPAALRKRIATAIGDGASWTADAAQLAKIDGWKGRRFGWLAKTWAAYNRGLTMMTFDGLSLTVPKTGHAYVILGATAEKMTRRLQAALPAILANPRSKVIVTGKPRRATVTEAEWMRRWLILNRVPADRILIEDQATSTLGNATHTVALLLKHKLTSYTLVSDASHLRRARILFLAARVKRELGTGKKTGLAAPGLIAHNDYDPGAPVKTLQAVDPVSRETTAKEVRALLGL